MKISWSDLECIAGKELGCSSWMSVEQETVDRFADLGGDHQWIHTDPVRAAETVFEGTIVHGYLILALTPALMDEVFTVADTKMAINRGFNKLRFITPLKVGSSFRLSIDVLSVKYQDDFCDVLFRLRFEGENLEKPICIAELLKRWVKA